MQAKVVIVDDNPAALSAMLNSVDWAAIGCVIAGTARDGEEGRDLLLKVRPDILLTNIIMPKMDGLQMLRAVRDRLPNMETIIITCHDQFEYTGPAFKLGVFDYLLKPIRPGEVADSVVRALNTAARRRQENDQLNQAARLRKQVQLLSLLTNPARTGFNVRGMLMEESLLAPAFYILIAQSENIHAFTPDVLQYIDACLSKTSFCTLPVVLYDSLVIYVMRSSIDSSWRDEASDLAAVVAQSSPAPVRIGISSLATSYHQLHAAYQQARQALWESTMDAGSQAADFYSLNEDQPSDVMVKMHEKMGELIRRTDLSDGAAEEAARVIIRLSGHQYSHLRALASLYVLQFTQKYPPSRKGSVEKALNDAWYVSSGEELVGCLKNLSATLKSSGYVNEDYSLLTRSVLEYIRIHAAEALRLADVARQFHVSANYLSALISRETGKLFHVHVLHARMDIARTMLSDPRMRIEEIAYAVGYSNYVSFYNAFRRAEGMTPTEYREKQ